MTVSILFGWQHVLTGLVLLIVLAAIFFLALAAGRGRRAEWQAFLDSRCRGHTDPAGDLDEASAAGGTAVRRPRPR